MASSPRLLARPPGSRRQGVEGHSAIAPAASTEEDAAAAKGSESSDVEVNPRGYRLLVLARAGRCGREIQALVEACGRLPRVCVRCGALVAHGHCLGVISLLFSLTEAVLNK